MQRAMKTVAKAGIPATLALTILVGCDSDTHGNLADSESTQTMNEDVQTYEPMADNSVNRENVPDSAQTVTQVYSGQTDYSPADETGSAAGADDSLASTQYQAVSFAPDSTELSPAAEEALATIVGNLQVGSPVALTMQAADPDNPEASAADESARARAQAVQSFIEQQGVKLHRVTFLGDAPAQPVADPKTGEVQQLFLYLVEQSDQLSTR